MIASYLPTLLRMRLLIGFLGERSHFAWWPTAFYETSSRLFLEPVFTKTSQLAQYHGVLEAARRLHDDHLSVGSYHLFRLPEEIEQDLHNLMQSTLAEEFAIQVTKSKDAALNALKSMYLTEILAGEGPIALGNIRNIKSDDTLAVIAGTYLSAFLQDIRSYPYLVN